MQDNQFDNIETLHITVEEIDDLLQDTTQHKKYGVFEVPLLYIYKNNITGTFAEFELNDVDPNIEANDAIAIFMQRVLDFGKIGANKLPDALLEVLEDAELDLFLLAHINEYYFKKIKEMIYIQKENQYYKD